MSAVAEQLRQAREAQKLSIKDVAEFTKVRADHVAALEQGDFNVFSAPVYIRGFVRTYAKMLKLDVAATIAALDAELGQSKKFREPPPLTENPKGVIDFATLLLSRLNRKNGLVILACGVVVIIFFFGFLAWRHARSADPLAKIPAGVYQGKPSSAETLPLPQAPR